jgi:hypothetical protein
LDVSFGGVMRLLGFDLDVEAVTPEGEVPVTLYWEAISPTDRDYTVFVHLSGEGERLVAQRDTFPGLGRLSTTALTPGFRWADRYVLRVPETAYAPDIAQVDVGVYDRVTGARLPAAETGGDHVRFGRIEIRPRTGDTPNSIFVNFGDRMALVGYDLDRLVAAPGETVTVTLYWQGLRPMAVNYNVSVQLIDAAQRKAAQRDGWPAGGAAPTSTWQPGQPLTDVYALSIAPDAASGVYDLRIAVYQFDDSTGGEIVHLPVTPPDGRMQSKQITLTSVRVGAP